MCEQYGMECRPCEGWGYHASAAAVLFNPSSAYPSATPTITCKPHHGHDSRAEEGAPGWLSASLKFEMPTGITVLFRLPSGVPLSHQEAVHSDMP